MGEVQGKKKGTGLREIKCAPGVCKVLVTQTPMCYSLYIPQLLAPREESLVAQMVKNLFAMQET